MKNKFYVLGSIFSFLSGLFTEFVLYVFYMIISCADSLNQSNGNAKSYEHIYLILLLLAIAIIGAVVLAVITFIKSLRKKPTPLAMIIYQMVTNFATFVFAIYAFVSTLLEGGTPDAAVFIGELIMIEFAAVTLIMYVLGLIKEAKEKKAIKNQDEIVE